MGASYFGFLVSRLIPMAFVMWEHLKGHVDTVRARTIDLMARIDTGVTMISVNVFKCVCVCVCV